MSLANTRLRNPGTSALCDDVPDVEAGATETPAQEYRAWWKLTAAMSPATFALPVLSQRRWWAIPRMLGVGTSTAAWQMSDELGPSANLSAIGRDAVDSSHGAWSDIQAVLFPFVCLIVMYCAWQ